MYKTRRDSWQEDEDRLLTNTVLAYIKEGESQLKAFKKVSEVLGRTAAGVGFRWNGTLRKHYEDDIAEAKRIKKMQKNNRIVQTKAPIDKVYVASDKIDVLDVLIEELIYMDDANKQMVNKIGAVKHSLRLLDDQMVHLRQQLSTPVATPEVDSEDIRALKLMFKKANEIIKQQENKKPAI